MKEAALYRIDYEINQSEDWQVNLMARNQHDAIEYLKKRTGTNQISIRQMSELGVVHQMTDSVADLVVKNRVGEPKQAESSTKEQPKESSDQDQQKKSSGSSKKN